MAGQYYAPDSSDLQVIYVDDYALIDQQANTGSLWGWGYNGYGQLGLNIASALGKGNSSPVQVTGGGTNWKQLSCGGLYTAAIKTDGTLWTWGRNSNGQLGDNTTVHKSSPVQVTGGGTNWKQVSSGFHTAAIKTDGTLWTWGQNNYGQLGDNTIVSKSTPVQVTMGGLANTNWKQVACGQYYTAAIKTDGTLWTWGQNNYGQLGIGMLSAVGKGNSSPIQVSGGGTNWKQVSCGYYHTEAIKTDGTLWACGRNDYGQLGDNSSGTKLSPVQTSSYTTWKSVICGNYHTVGVKTDGTLWVWGRNDYGQLGINIISAAFKGNSLPIQTVSGGTDWKQVSCGGYFTIAIKTDGTLWTWGYNSTGNLGLNDTTHRSSPIQTVSGGTNWKQVACGTAHTEAIYFYDAGNLYPSA